MGAHSTRRRPKPPGGRAARSSSTRGPGTGKTATLVGRVAHLLATGVPASRILVLTFSTRAAGELRQRVTEVARDAAGDLWTGTFHAFGLEVLHGWHDLVGRGPRPRILDRDGALDLLERNLHRLPPLSVHRDLRNPAVGLAPVLRTITRCKDEMITPDDYAAAVRGASLDGGEAVVAAEEFVAIYETYQRLLADEDALDLGDLVTEAARLLEGHDDVARHYGERFAHVLVDEYQDVNAASVRLLGALCGPGTNLWVVGDARQSIYRFRGAEPGNVDRFATEFGGETLSLKRNYRASNAIVGAFGTFARTMGSSTARWQAQRDEGEAVRVMSAPNVGGECLAIRDRIEELRDEGVALGDQAILARTHGALDRIGHYLERLGVPLLHIGDLFARDEVRDLLALLSIDAEPGGVGLLRLAALPVYAIPRSDALEVIRWAAVQKLSIVRAPEPGRDDPRRQPEGRSSAFAARAGRRERRARGDRLDGHDDLALRDPRAELVGRPRRGPLADGRRRRLPAPAPRGGGGRRPTAVPRSRAPQSRRSGVAETTASWRRRPSGATPSG